MLIFKRWYGKFSFNSLFISFYNWINYNNYQTICVGVRVLHRVLLQFFISSRKCERKTQRKFISLQVFEIVKTMRADRDIIYYISSMWVNTNILHTYFFLWHSKQLINRENETWRKTVSGYRKTKSCRWRKKSRQRNKMCCGRKRKFSNKAQIAKQ